MVYGDIRKYLPQYLSDGDTKRLLGELNSFPKNIDKRLYVTGVDLDPTIYQGDGLVNIPYIKPPETAYKSVPAIVISNTCDIDKKNSRISPVNLIYAPILNLSKYETGLSHFKDPEFIETHIDSIKKQKISNIFYLPAGMLLKEDSIVFLDKVANFPIDSLDYDELIENRLFVLSDYGFYLFLFKLSIHFTRVREGVRRGQTDH